MTNSEFASIDDFDDVLARNDYALRLAAGDSASAILADLALNSRDNARTPMQWSDGPGAGFTSGTPWIGVNPNSAVVNAAAQVDDPRSVYAHYRRLIALKKRNRALWNGADGAVMEPVANSAPKQVFGFVRDNGKDKVLAVFNLSAQPVEVKLTGTRPAGRYLDFNDGAEVSLEDGSALRLPAWGWRVLVQ